VSSGPRRIDPTDPRPIWRQIEDGLRQEIVLGRLAPGGPVPSVRDLARELRVNPNTVARAIQSLADAGVVETRRGEGTFVAAEPPAIPRAELAARLREEAGRYVAQAIALGADLETATAAVETAFQKLEKGIKERR
jgi:GntR family transcriptional regulator